jgi:hypothetical protein
MKIDGQPTSELLQQMQELHQDSVEQTGNAESASFTVDQTEASAPVHSVEVSPLQERIEVEATRALNGDFASDADIRGAVIDAILDERLGDRVSGSDRRKMVKTLKENLVEDPGFVRQVDDMLLLAARELARRG